MQPPEDVSTAPDTQSSLEADPKHPLRSLFNLRQAHANTSYTVGIYSAVHRIIAVAHDSGSAMETAVETQHHTHNAMELLSQKALQEPAKAAIYRSLRISANITFPAVFKACMLIAFITSAGALLQPHLFPQADYPLITVIASTSAATIAFISARRWRNLRAAATDAENFIAQGIPRIAHTPYQTSHRITDRNRILIVMSLHQQNNTPPTPESTTSCAS